MIEGFLIEIMIERFLIEFYFVKLSVTSPSEIKNL